MLVGPPGCGKTKELLVEMTSVPGRYVFALPTTELIDEKLGDLHNKAAKSGTRPVILAIHSRVARRRSASINREIAEAIEAYSLLPHVILVVTHEGMMATDFACASSRPWHVRIDEVPSATVAGEFRIPSSSRFFEASYDLSPVEGTEWHLVSLSGNAPSMSDMMADDLVKGVLAFHKRAKSPQGIFVDVPDWRDARDRDRTVRWWSAWTPAELAPFATSMIAGAGFFHSLTHLTTRKWSGEEVEFVRREVEANNRAGKPKVRIRYFTHGHRASTEWWFPKDPKKSREGKRCLAAVCRHLEGVHDLGYWSGNNEVVSYFERRLDGEQVRPKVAGSNLYRRHTSCAFIYSSKVRPEDSILLNVFGLTREEVERAREQEDIWQFVMRGAIRMAEFDSIYTVYLYDRGQAETLAEMLRSEGISEDVTLEPVHEAGILDVERPKPGPRPGAKAAQSEKSFEERETERRAADRERKQRQREKERAAREAAGTVRGRGRPTKDSGAEAST
ncbi:hypothetical protein JMJ55_04275 [Belnapia sp. T6]|uniref:Uncharacterized protein n=1 Tax=Belnapia mucosa TaxID=2804532 RepID=A0ABS1UYJ2_9PROT|nr:hypothetical protein [Belnapia mucosa]MBL6454528.1 hypothetical protein [Belnapia mucosa]